jgi:hypothetical protein
MGMTKKTVIMPTDIALNSDTLRSALPRLFPHACLGQKQADEAVANLTGFVEVLLEIQRDIANREGENTPCV